MASPIGACRGVGLLLLPFVLGEDLARILVSRRGAIGVCDPDIKDCGLLFCPKAMDSNIASEVLVNWCFRGAWRLLFVPTCVDERFVGDSRRLEGTGAHLTPLCRDIVVAVEDEASLLAGLGVVEVELLPTPVTFRWEFERSESKAKPKAVAELLLGQDGAIERVWDAV